MISYPVKCSCTGSMNDMGEVITHFREFCNDAAHQLEDMSILDARTLDMMSDAVEESHSSAVFLDRLSDATGISVSDIITNLRL